MSKFRITDHVRVTHSPSCWFDKTGVVTDIDPHAPYPFFVDLDDGGQVAFRESELILADVVEFPAFTTDRSEITFDEVVALSRAATRAATAASAATMAASAEAVNHPAHYGGDTTYETIKVIEAWGLDDDAYLFNVIKYVSRAGRKGAVLDDLRKARFYLDRRIARMEPTGAP